jgi:hypothetical protein
LDDEERDEDELFSLSATAMSLVEQCDVEFEVLVAIMAAVAWAFLIPIDPTSCGCLCLQFSSFFFFSKRFFFLLFGLKCIIKVGM